MWIQSLQHVVGNDPVEPLAIALAEGPENRHMFFYHSAHVPVLPIEFCLIDSNFLGQSFPGLMEHLMEQGIP